MKPLIDIDSKPLKYKVSVKVFILDTRSRQVRVWPAILFREKYFDKLYAKQIVNSSHKVYVKVNCRDMQVKFAGVHVV